MQIPNEGQAQTSRCQSHRTLLARLLPMNVTGPTWPNRPEIQVNHTSGEKIFSQRFFLSGQSFREVHCRWHPKQLFQSARETVITPAHFAGTVPQEHNAKTERHTVTTTTDNIIDTIRTSLSRAHYRSSWRRLRESDQYGQGPAACHIHNGQPTLAGGSAAAAHPGTTNEITHHSKADKRSTQKTKSTGSNSPSTGEKGDDGGGDGDGDGDPDRHRCETSTTYRPSTQKSSGSIFPDIALWRLDQVLDHIPVSKSTWWAGVKSGRYPPGIKISSKCTAWRVKDILTLAQTFYADHAHIGVCATQFTATEEACK